MNPRDVSLRSATTPQLVEELARRLNEAHQGEDPPEQWCDECVHFKVATGKFAGERPDYNPCRMKHKLSFYVPQPHDGPETFGYFRPVCADRQPLPEPTGGFPGVPRRGGCP